MTDTAFLSHDIAAPAPVQVAEVVQPASVDELVAAVRDAIAAGRPVVARGGGMSYTGGYLAQRPDTLMIDTKGLGRVVEVATEDQFVTVEAGCTWRALDEALKGTGMRPPCFGPLSGFVSTVGGFLSNDGVFFGSGWIAESVLGLEVVLADGSLLRTGSAAAVARRPFARQFGPDLTGLFIGDCGAFGVKARATLRLVPDSPEKWFVSFAFETGEALVAAQLRMAGLPGLNECYGFDPVTHDNLRRSGFNIWQSLEMLIETARAHGLIKAAKMAAQSYGFLDPLQWTLHLTAGNAACADRARTIMREEGGIEIPDTIPRVTRAKPFRPIKALLGPQGERWVPMNGIFPLSTAQRAFREVRALVAARQSSEFRVSYLTLVVGNCFFLEPQFFWKDDLSAFHRGAVTPDQLAKFGSAPARPEVRANVSAIRREMVSLFDRLGAIHVQAARFYPYLDQLDAPARETMLGLKRMFDPRGLMNPGVLGL